MTNSYMCIYVMGLHSHTYTHEDYTEKNIEGFILSYQLRPQYLVFNVSNEEAETNNKQTKKTRTKRGSDYLKTATRKKKCEKV